MSRLDLLRKGSAGAKSVSAGRPVKKEKKESFDVEQVAIEPDDSFADLDTHFDNGVDNLGEALKNETQYEEDNHSEDSDDIDVHELDLSNVDLDDSFMADEDKEEPELEESEELKAEDEVKSESISKIEENFDIKGSMSVLFGSKEHLCANYLNFIKGIGLEIRSEEQYLLSDVIEITVAITEINTENTCYAKVICIFPKETRTMSSKNTGKRYWLQLIGREAESVRELTSRYLFGHKSKK